MKKKSEELKISIGWSIKSRSDKDNLSVIKADIRLKGFSIPMREGTAITDEIHRAAWEILKRKHSELNPPPAITCHQCDEILPASGDPRRTEWRQIRLEGNLCDFYCPHHWALLGHLATPVEV